MTARATVATTMHPAVATMTFGQVAGSMALVSCRRIITPPGLRTNEVGRPTNFDQVRPGQAPDGRVLNLPWQDIILLTIASRQPCRRRRRLWYYLFALPTLMTS